MRKEGDDEGGFRRSDPGNGATADADHYAAIDRARRARLVKAIIALGLAVILIVFIVANSQKVRVNFLVFDSNIRLIWVIFWCSVIGGVVGFLIGKPGRQFGRKRSDDDKD